MSDIFEKASRQKIRFSTSRGVLGVEDLWDLKLEQLDSIAISLDEEKGKTTKSFVKTRSVANTILELKFDVVKHIIDVKMAEEEARAIAKDKRARKERLLELIENKENEALGQKSVEDLKKELLELEA